MHARVGVREIHYATQQLADTPQRRALPVLDPSPELIYLLVKPLRLLHQRHRLLRVLVRRLGILKRIQRASCIIDDTQGSLGKGGLCFGGDDFPEARRSGGGMRAKKRGMQRALQLVVLAALFQAGGSSMSANADFVLLAMRPY